MPSVLLSSGSLVRFNKIRDLFKVKLNTIRSETKKKREVREREKKKRKNKREREKREKEKKEREKERDFKYLLTLILTGRS